MWSKPMRFAYADPPYIGQAKRHYSPDGWALSASAPSLATILPLCPSGYRVAVWARGGNLSDAEVHTEEFRHIGRFRLIDVEVLI